MWFKYKENFSCFWNLGGKMYNNDIFLIKGKKEIFESLFVVVKEKIKE